MTDAYHRPRPRKTLPSLPQVPDLHCGVSVVRVSLQRRSPWPSHAAQSLGMVLAAPYAMAYHGPDHAIHVPHAQFLQARRIGAEGAVGG
jgi:hypothetical protein